MKASTPSEAGRVHHAVQIAEAIRAAARIGQAFSVTAYAKARGWATGGTFHRAFKALYGMGTTAFYEACAGQEGSR